MTTLTAPSTSHSAPALPLRRLYFIRAAFAAIWATLLATSGSALEGFTGVLLVIYPVVDAVAAVIDARSTRDGRARAAAVTNVAISSVAAFGLAIASSADITDVMRVWGGWAIASGLVQLGGAALRRHHGGQRFLIASGALSVLAGISFVISAAQATTLAGLAGYAALGGIFFLASALRLGRSTREGA